jgi:hypothetical protein
LVPIERDHSWQENPEDDFIFYEGSLEPQHGDFSRAPIIGILTTPWNGTEYDKQSGFLDHYVRWLEQGGAKIVPIKVSVQVVTKRFRLNIGILGFEIGCKVLVVF